jgi:hypothetical protein
VRRTWWRGVLLGFLALAFWARLRREPQRSEVAIVPGPVRPPRVGAALRPGEFRLVDVSEMPEGGTRYTADATDGRGGAPGCSFSITLGKPKNPSDSFAFAGARLARRPAQNCTGFLKALARELGFAGELPAPRPVASLDAQVAILGRDQSRGDQGGFTSEPAGPWTAAKLFLAGGEGEAFLNLNPTDRVGEFTLKDEEYATTVITELAKILLPEGP